MTWMQTASGRRFDLADPRAADVDFDTDVPDALARIARFNGHIGGGVYSVAQHSTHAGDIVMGETGDPVASAYAHLHDAKEAYITDVTTPQKQALAVWSGRLAREWCPPDMLERVTAHVVATFEAMEEAVDRAIHEAAGLPWPPPAGATRLLKDADLRLLQDERLQLLNANGRPQPRWWWDGTKAQPRPSRLALRIEAWTVAADRFRERFRRVVPEARAKLARLAGEGRAA